MKKLIVILAISLLGVRAEAAQQAAQADSEESLVQAQISRAYRDFRDSYRLGPGDVIAVRIDRHPEDSLDRAVVSPFGDIYHPLLGNVPVAGKTLSQLEERLAMSLSEYIREPRVVLSLLEANSAKVGVLGQVKEPGVKVMARPMRVLDAIALAGGLTDSGNSSSVAVLRQSEDGQIKLLRFNLKRILEGKAGPEENFQVRAGDVILVHDNKLKKLSAISDLLGIGSFIGFLLRGSR
jgi:polysaccharide export outer membrane protein